MDSLIEKNSSVCWELARAVEQSLIEEVSLTPKPGLVDCDSNGTHKDMDYLLFIKSANVLTPYFYEMAQAAWGKPINQKLREEIAEIGRIAEAAMYKATNQVNTHKGAIWALGLFISVAANQISQKSQLDTALLFEEVAKLAAFPDTGIKKSIETHGNAVKKIYKVSGAYGEAVSGYPHVQVALKEAEKHRLESKEICELHMLLAIISSLDDTCILYRSNQQTLNKVRSLAATANCEGIKSKAFNQLVDYCKEQGVSPGGSADLLSVAIFIQSLEKKNWNNKEDSKEILAFA